MARLISFVTIIAIALVSVLAAPQEGYSDKYDYIDVNSILANDKLRNQYYICFYGSGPCTTEDMKYFKDIISEAVYERCQKCTKKQFENLKLVSNWYKQNSYNEWINAVGKAVEDMKKKKNSTNLPVN